MSGHSKWATTKRKKARIDSARAKVFNRIIRELTIASRLGGSNPENNARLSNAIVKAKAANMPAKNIETAVAKGAGELEGVNYIEITYEGYGPGGTAIMVDTITDNKVRTVAELRHLFSKCSGNLGEAGSVGWMFKTKGIVTVPKDAIGEEALFDLATEAGAEDLDASGDEYEIRCETENYQALLDALSGKSIQTASADIVKLADNPHKVTGDEAAKTLRLLDMLDEHDDVQNVSTNADFDQKDLDEA